MQLNSGSSNIERLVCLWAIATVFLTWAYLPGPQVIPIPRDILIVVEREVVVPAVELPRIENPIADQYWLSSGFGYRLGYGGQAGFHRGIDLAAPTGTPVRSPVSGVVVEHWPPPGNWYRGHPIYGGAVFIYDEDRGLLVLLAHLSRSGVHTGQRVEAGELIGQVGSTGWSTGPHLHIEVWIDPTTIIEGVLP